MAKGFFTQGVCLLTNGQSTLADIASLLRQHGFEIVKESPAQANWAFGGPTLVMAYRPEANGYASVDIVDRPWPDSMGDPKSDPMVFGAWSMGHFGPYAYPGGLSRAGQHSWTWESGRTIAQAHRGFIRLRVSYIFGARGDAPVMPADCNPADELMFLSRAVSALIAAPGVLCYFNPNGEVLRDEATFSPDWHASASQRKLPLLLWMNVRLFNLSEEFAFMDTVGNAQLDVRDVEAVFPYSRYRPGDIDYYLRNVTHYLLDSGCEMKSGESIDGPGESNLSWTLELHDESHLAPPRRVLRLFPKAKDDAIRAVLARSR